MSNLSKFYDFYDGPEGREAQFDFYASLLDSAQGRSLELACGTGIITLELARRGYRITGLDYDEDMLTKANWKLASEDADVQKRVNFQHADMKHFSLKQRFGAAFIPTNSFGYLLKLQDQRASLECVREHLLPGGVLAIEEPYYSPENLVQMANMQGVERTWESRINPQTGKYTMFKSCIRHIDFASQTIFQTTFVDEVQEDGTIVRYVPDAPYFGNTKYYFGKNELQLLVESCGFTVREIWGGYAGQPITNQNNHIILVAEKSN